MTSRVRNGVITARTMRDTLLRTGITAMNEEHNRMDINQIDPIDRIIQITVDSRIGVLTVIRIEDPMVARTEGMATRTGALMATRTGVLTVARIEGMAVRTGALMAIRIKDPTAIVKAARENAGQEWANGYNRRKEAPRGEDMGTGAGEISRNTLAIGSSKARQKRSLKRSSEKFNQTIVMITHNNEIAQLADRIVRIEDGRISNR